MQQVANDLLSLCLLKDERVFFFPRLTYNLVFVLRLSYSLRISLQYLIGERCRGNFFVSQSNILLGRDVEGTSSYRDCSYAKELIKGKVIL